MHVHTHTQPQVQENCAIAKLDKSPCTHSVSVYIWKSLCALIRAHTSNVLAGHACPKHTFIILPTLHYTAYVTYLWMNCEIVHDQTLPQLMHTILYTELLAAFTARTLPTGAACAVTVNGHLQCRRTIQWCSSMHL